MRHLIIKKLFLFTFLYIKPSLLLFTFKTREKEKVIEKVIYFSSQQEQSNKDEEIPAPQINRAEILKSCSVDELEAEIRRRALEQKKKELNNEWGRYLDGFVF